MEGMTTTYLLFETYYGECACASDQPAFRGAFPTLEAAQKAQRAAEKYGTILNPWVEKADNDFFDSVTGRDRVPTGLVRIWEKGSYFVAEVEPIGVSAASL